jgi:hypothetical protein
MKKCNNLNYCMMKENNIVFQETEYTEHYLLKENTTGETHFKAQNPRVKVSIT